MCSVVFPVEFYIVVSPNPTGRFTSLSLIAVYPICENPCTRVVAQQFEYSISGHHTIHASRSFCFCIHDEADTGLVTGLSVMLMAR